MELILLAPIAMVGCVVAGLVKAVASVVTASLEDVK